MLRDPGSWQMITRGEGMGLLISISLSVLKCMQLFDIQLQSSHRLPHSGAREGVDPDFSVIIRPENDLFLHFMFQENLESRALKPVDVPISISASCLVFIILQIFKLFSSDTQCSLLSKVCSAKTSDKKYCFSMGNF